MSRISQMGYQPARGSIEGNVRGGSDFCFNLQHTYEVTFDILTKLDNNQNYSKIQKQFV